MKLVKNFVFAALLVSSLAFNTFAGDIEIPGIHKPGNNPPPLSTSEGSTEPIGVETQGTETSDYLFYEALAALLSMY
jgi:hypothetical protein